MDAQHSSGGGADRNTEKPAPPANSRAGHFGVVRRSPAISPAHWRWGGGIGPDPGHTHDSRKTTPQAMRGQSQAARAGLHQYHDAVHGHLPAPALTGAKRRACSELTG